jgi:hypothetical protein
MSERTMMEASYLQKKMERMRLATEAQRLINAIKMIIQPASITPLEQLKTADAAELVKQLHRVKTRYDKATVEVGELKEALGIDED